MAKRRRNPSPPQQDENTSDFDSLFFDTSDSPPGKPVQRNAANARERARMRVLSRAFSRLKTSLPWVPQDTKLSKLDTLRLASTYIAHLRTILRNDCGDDVTRLNDGLVVKNSVHPITLTWPFTISNKPGSGEDSSTSTTMDHREVPEPETSYQNYPPCEYMSKNYSDHNRRELYGHYMH